MTLTKEQIQEIIKETVSEAVTPIQQQQTQWMERLFSAAKPKAEPVKGEAVGRIVRALAASKGDPERAARWAKQQWADDEGVTKALAAGDAVAGGFIVPSQHSADIIELLRAQSVVRRLNPIVMPMPTGSLEIPKLTGGATAGYVGENQNIGKTEQQFGMLKLTYKKLAALVPISNDLLRFSSPSADSVVRDDLVAAMALREDLAFLRGDGTQDTPKGMRNWAPSGNVINANGTVSLDNVTIDLGKLILKLKGANVRMLRPGWVFSPRSEHYLMTVRDGNGNFVFRDEMMAGRLWGFPFMVTTQIPENLGAGSNESEVYLVDFADAVIGEASSLIIDASTEAAYYDGSAVQSSFSRDQTVVRAIAQHDFGMRHDASIAVLDQVKWGA